jgi:hypothetical protein
VSVFGEWAAKLARDAALMQDGMAEAIVREQARDFLAVERIVTPKRTGRLAESEKVDAVMGGGSHAEAVVSPHTVYAHFRENGGTITRHLPPPHVLGPYGGPYFGHSVTQAGSHYVERAEGIAAPLMAAVAEQVLEETLDL